MDTLDPIRTMTMGGKQKRWEPYAVPPAALAAVLAHGKAHNGVTMVQAFSGTRFVLVDGIAGGMVGMTLNDTVILCRAYVDAHRQIMLAGVMIDPSIPGLVYHELVHRTQIMRDGWWRFLARYVWQWIRSGCSYDKMKAIGYELEAYTAQRELVRELLGHQPTA